MTEKNILTVAEFCEQARICRATFYALLKNKNTAPTILKIGKRTFVSKEAFFEWIGRMEKASANRNDKEKAVA